MKLFSALFTLAIGLAALLVICEARGQGTVSNNIFEATMQGSICDSNASCGDCVQQFDAGSCFGIKCKDGKRVLVCREQPGDTCEQVKGKHPNFSCSIECYTWKCKAPPNPLNPVCEFCPCTPLGGTAVTKWDKYKRCTG